MTAYVRLTLRPGEKGTRALTRQFGDRLVAVRYRYDETRLRRQKTIELIVDESPWIPRHPSGLGNVRIAYHETRLRQLAKSAGGKWLPEQKLWQLDQSRIVELGLTDRLVEMEPSDGDMHG